MDRKICSECGTENESDYIYCKNCGTLLTSPTKPAEPENKQPEHEFIAETAPAPKTAPEFASQAAEPKAEQSSFRPAPEAAEPAFSPAPPVYNTENGNTGYAQSGAPSPDGIPQEEIALFIGKKAAVIMPKFIKMEITNSKTSWCWPAALLGFFFGSMGAALWFYYRKMYKPAALLTVIGAVINIVTAALTFNSGSVDFTALYRSILAGDAQSIINAFKTLGDSSTVLDFIATAISNAADLATCILTGLYGYYLYKEHCIKSINRFRMSIPDRRYYTMGLASVGGVSGGMLAVGIICMIVVSNLITVLTSVVSML